MVSELLIYVSFCRECRENPYIYSIFSKKIPIYPYVFQIEFPIIVPIFFWWTAFKPDYVKDHNTQKNSGLSRAFQACGQGFMPPPQIRPCIQNTVDLYFLMECCVL